MDAPPRVEMDMRTLLLTAISLAVFQGTAASAGTPVVVDREMVLGQIQSIHGQIAAFRRQFVQDPALRGQLRSIMVQLRGLEGLLSQAAMAPMGPMMPAPVQVMMPPAPPPAPVIVAMEAGAFQQLLGAVNNESFGRDKLRVVREAAKGQHFEVQQVVRLLGAFSFPGEQIQALEIVAPRILDRQNVFQIYSVFTFPSYKRQAEGILSK
jgi:hypothetical protein